MSRTEPSSFLKRAGSFHWGSPVLLKPKEAGDGLRAPPQIFRLSPSAVEPEGMHFWQVPGEAGASRDFTPRASVLGQGPESWSHPTSAERPLLIKPPEVIKLLLVGGDIVKKDASTYFMAGVGQVVWEGHVSE